MDLPPPDPCREAIVGYPRQETQTGDIRHVHDPEIVKGEDAYYVLSTNDGVPIRRSNASVLREGDDYLLVHHFYDGQDNGVPPLQIRPLLWDADLWPLAGEPYRGQEMGAPEADVDLAGTWGYWTSVLAGDGETFVGRTREGDLTRAYRLTGGG